VLLEAIKSPPATQNETAQATFSLEVTAPMKNRSGKTAPNLLLGNNQDLIRGSLKLSISLSSNPNHTMALKPIRRTP